ncbi:uncharacterized protein MONBRDRAFT_5263 [Monosiga brevicollis MX1]|uniref:Uncharacterized protein n=1 Tax=Monosiga brevicollis TaxID=81824 RepID=A9UQF6_MONBE|nr:uncharacterized protein MONBRDRAFT_5263 [Monosiga brevicollis MX1]EDQ92590.1 predicted protein [Monosiga brevicollis MX1]|eukprot:XP_001742352.1 hypothetical protein [Monosiga brevicollis MX1]
MPVPGSRHDLVVNAKINNMIAMPLYTHPNAQCISSDDADADAVVNKVKTIVTHLAHCLLEPRRTLRRQMPARPYPRTLSIAFCGTCARHSSWLWHGAVPLRRTL